VSQGKSRDFTDHLVAFLCAREGRSDEELDADLKAEGVDAAALIADVDAIVAEAKRRARQAKIARFTAKGAAIVARVPDNNLYEGMTADELRAQIRQRAQDGAAAYFRSYEEASDEDLRRMLAQLDAVKPGPRKGR